jgi:glycosyltransferase involved in cell wall biosynthesis
VSDLKQRKLLTSIVPSNNPSASKEFLQHFVDSDIDSCLILIQHSKLSESELLELKEIISINPDKAINLILAEHTSAGEGRNIGIMNADSEWIAFHDCDDSPIFENIMEMIESAKKQKKHVAVGEYLENVIVDGVMIGNKKVGTDSLSLLMKPGIWRYAFTSYFVGDLRFQPWKLGEDLEFLAKLDFRLKNLYRSPNVVYRYNFEKYRQGKEKYYGIHRGETGFIGLLHSSKRQFQKFNTFQFIFSLFHTARLFRIPR